MKYPRWFPFPSCWLRALITWLTANLIGLALFVLAPLSFGLGGLFFAVGGSAPTVISLVLGAIGAIILIATFLLFPSFIYAHIRQIGRKLSGREQSISFIPRWTNWRSAIGDEAVLFAGMFFGVLFLVGRNPQMLSDVPYLTEPSDDEIAIASIIGLTVTSYCYHFRVLFHRYQERSRKRANINRNRQTLRKTKGKFSTVVDDPIELEMMRLRRKL